MKPRILSVARLSLPFAMAIASLLSVQYAQAQTTRYWDSDGTIAGFGATTGTWGSSAFWSATATGGSPHAAVTTTAAADTVNFGTATVNYGNAAVAVDAGGVTATSIVIGSFQSTPLTIGALTGQGTITLGGTTRTIVANSTGHKILSPIALTAATTVTLAVAGTPTFTLGAMSGTGGLTLQNTNNTNPNPATFILGGASTYTGNTTLTSTGTNASVALRTDVDNALPSTTVLTMATVDGSGSGRSMTFNLNGKNQTLAGLTNGGSATPFRNQIVTSSIAATLTVNNTTNMTYGGTTTNTNTSGTFTANSRITGSLSIVKGGSGVWTLSGSNTYTGVTTVNAGTITVANATALGATAANTVVASGGRVFVGTTGLSVAEPFNITGTGATTNGAINIGGSATGVAFTGGITLGGDATIQGDGSTSSTFSGGINLGANTLTFKESGTITVDTVGISGTGGSVVKNTGGTLNFNTANSYTGASTVNAGGLRISNNAGLGTTDGSTVVNGSATGGTNVARLELSGGITVTGEALTINGAGTNLGALTSVSGVNEWAGNVTIGLAGTRLGGAAGTTLKVSGVIDSGAVNTGLIIRATDATSLVVLSGANTYLGDTNLIIGKLQLDGGNDRLPVATKFSIGNAANIVEFDLNGRSQEIAGLTLNASVTAANNSVNNSSVTASTLTVNTAAASPSSFAGILKGNLALTKTGADSLTLSGDNSYSGATLVSAGTLTLSGTGDINSSSGIAINGSTAKFLQTSSVAASPAVTLTEGTVTGSGSVTIDTVTAANNINAIISNNDGVVGAPLTIGTLTFDGAAMVNTYSSSTSAAIVTTGLVGNGSASQVIVNPIASSWTSGATYDLISFGGGSITGAGGFSQFKLGNITGLGARQTASALGSSTTAITIAITGNPIYWVGDGDGKWNNLAPVNNWKLLSNDNYDSFLATDEVIFNDSATGAGPITVDINTTDVAPVSTVFSNATKAYVLNGAFGISTGTLTKSGAGILTINNVNSYSGATTVSAGTLNLEGSLTGATAITVSGAGVLSESSVGIIGGAASFSQASSGTSTLAGSNTYSGTTTIAAGILNANSSAALGNGSATNTLIFAGGTLQAAASIASPSTRLVTLSSTGVIDTNGNAVSFGGSMSGTGGLTKNGAGTLTSSAFNSFTGPITINSGTLEFFATATGVLYGSTQININNGSTLRISAQTGNQDIYNGRNYTFDATGGGSILVGTGNYNAVSTPFSITTNGGVRNNIGLITTSGTLGFNLGLAGNVATFNVALGSDATSDLTVTPIMGNAGSILKTGTGRLTLTGANTYSGTTTINAGTLNANSTTALGNGSATNTLIFTGGTLQAGAAITSPVARTVTLTNTGLINTNNFAVSIAGAMSGAGGLSKSGLGTLTLSGANTYTGDTSISAGTLAISGTGALANTAIGVTGNSIFAVRPPAAGSVNLGNSSTVGVGATLNLGSGTTFSMVDGVVGTANLVQEDTFAGNALTLETATLNFELSGATADNLAVSGALATASVTGVNTINLTPVAALTAGTYNLITTANPAGGLSTGGSFALANGQTTGFVTFGGNSYAITLNNAANIQSVTVGDVIAAAMTWTGQTAGNGATDTSWNTTASSNFAVGGTPVAYNNGNDVTFQDINTFTSSEVAAPSLAVTVQAGGVAPGSTTFNNSSVNYTVGGGAIAGVGGLTKLGTGTVTLSGLSDTAASNYSGATTIGLGTLAFSTTNPSLTGGLTFGATVNSSNTGALDLSGVASSATFAGAMLVQTNSVTANTITLGASKTLTLNNGLTMSNTVNNAETRLTMTGGGAFVVNGTSMTVGSNSGGTNISGEAHLDMAALGSFTTTLSGNLIIQAVGDNGVGNNPASMTLSNGANSITAASVRVGNSSNGSNIRLWLGGSTNVIQTDLINLGAGGRDTGIIDFAGTGGSVTLRNVAGTGRIANVNLGVQSTQSTAYTTANLIDLTGNTADVAIGTFATSLGAKTAANTNDLLFDTGTLDIRSINMAFAKGTGASTNRITIGGGTVSLGGSVAFSDAGTGVLTLATAGSGELIINGGTVTSTANLLKGTGTGTATVTINGGTLDMTGRNIGSTFDTVVLAAQSGTLLNLAELNGGGTLTKTTSGTLILAGTQTYTGGTTVNAGTLKLDYAASDTSKLSDLAVLTFGGGTLDLSGGTHTEVVVSTTLTAGTSSRVTSSVAGSVLQTNTITPGVGSVIDFGTENIATTDNLNTNGILGTWATFNGTDWAMNSGSATSGGATVPGAGIADGFIRVFTAYTDVTRLSPGTIADGAATNVRIIEGSGAAGSILLGATTTTINTLNQSASGGNSPAVIDPVGQTLATNSILVGTGAGALTIGTGTNNGFLSAATAAGDLSLINYTASALTINSIVADNATSSLSTEGSGPVILTGVNTYAGATTIGSNLQISGAGSLGAGTYAAAITNNGTLQYSSSAAQTISGNIGGTGALLKDTSASSTLTLSGLNNYTGNTTVNLGTLEISGTGYLYGATQPSSATTTTVATGAQIILSGAVTTNALGFGNNMTWAVAGTINSTGGAAHTLPKNVNLNNGTLTGIAAIAPNEQYGTFFSGTSSSIITANGATNTISASNVGMASGSILTLTTPLVGDALSISSALGVTGQLGGALTKSGLGTVTLSGTNIYTGATTVSAGTLTVAAAGSITTSGNILLNVSGASAVANIDGAYTSTGGGGVAINSGGILNSSGTVAISGANNQAILMGTAAGPGTWNVTGGSVSTNYTSNGWGLGSGGVGTLNVSAGAVNTAATNVFNVGHGAGGTGILTVSGTGLVTVNAGSGVFRIGANATSTGVVNLDGGTLALGRNVTTVAGSTSTFNFNGGLLQAGLSSATYMTGLSTANVRNGGAKINTNNFNITIGQALIHSVIGGDNATDGGLAKSGAGTLTLTSVNTYTGATSVSAGTLLITGSIASTASVATTGTLAGSGTITGATTVATTGTISPGNSDVNTLNFGSDLTLDTGSEYAVGITGATTNDKVNVTGALVANGTIKVTLTGYVPVLNDTFDIADVTGSTTGTPTFDFTNAVLSSGLAWDTSSFATNGTIKVISGDPFGTWATLNSVVGGKGGDDDGDGVSNLLEFATNSDPKSGTSGARVYAKMHTLGADNALTYTVATRKDSVFAVEAVAKQRATKDKVQYTIEATNDLTTWNTVVVTELGAVDAAAVRAAIVPALPALGADWEWHTFRTDDGSAIDPQDFIRLQVEATP